MPGGETSGDLPTATSATPGETEPERRTLDTKKELPVVFTVAFDGASHTGKAGELSRLKFLITPGQEGNQFTSKRLEISADNPDNNLRLELPECGVEFTPVIKAPIGLGQGRYGSYGGYNVTLFSPGRQALAEFEVDKAGKLAQAEELSGNTLKKQLDAPTEGLTIYSLFAPDAKRDEPLMTVEFKVGGFETQVAEGGGDSYEYRFPGLELTVHNAALARDMQLSRGTNQQASPNDPAGGLWVLR